VVLVFIFGDWYSGVVVGILKDYEALKIDRDRKIMHWSRIVDKLIEDKDRLRAERNEALSGLERLCAAMEEIVNGVADPKGFAAAALEAKEK